MRGYIELKFQNRNILIPKKQISWIEHWESNQIHHLIIHLSCFDSKGIPVPVDQSQRVLKEMKEFWGSENE